ncbi:MAG: hypothetical protein LAP13_23590 [Acidobacteriia bacterium]|nr:hypothetical protein [Terriglobia bacterium]
MPKTRNILHVVCGLIYCASLATASLAASPQTIWQIGKFDRSSIEFNDRVNLRDPNVHPTFVVGQSDPAKDWPAFQPGTADKGMGGRPHPYTINFNLPGPPSGIYDLTVAVILNRSRVPNLQVDINGGTGLFYFQRKTSYYPGDFGADSPIYGVAELKMVLPTAALKAGKNKLVLTAVDDPKDGEGDSSLSYDALRLSQERGSEARRLPRATVEPTIYYVRKDAQVRELADVTLTLDEKVREGSVELALGGEKFRAELSSERDFGEQRIQFAIPELTGKTTATVTLRVNGKSHKSEVAVEPMRKWTLFVVPHAHLDIGFTDYQAKVAEVHNRNIDKLLEEIRQSPEMRFSLDGSWIVQQYRATRNPRALEEFFKLVREGKIVIPVQIANLLTGYPSLEELIRSTDYSAWLHRKLGVPFDYANITDVPSYSWSYPSVLSALGVKYFAAAANSDRAPILLYGRWNEKSPFWWQGPDGRRILMSYSRQYFQFSFICGVPAQEPACRQSLPTFLQAFEAPEYKPDAVLLFGSQIENTDLIPGEPEFVKAWNERYAYPKMVLATFPDYFHYIEQHYGPSLETVVGDGGPYWEDGLGTDAYYVAIDRASQQRAPSAEKLATLGAYLHKNFAGPEEEIRRMWENLALYAEHTFTSWGAYSRPQSEESVRQLASKDQHAVEGREEVNAIVDQSLSQLADQIHLPATALVVFNPLSWARSGLVETDLDVGKTLEEYPAMTLVPVDVLRKGSGYNHVRFLARDVPSVGYKCYRIADERGRGSATLVETPLPIITTLENPYYRIEINPAAGAVKSVYDKQLGRELVDATSPYRFNQYLYVSGGDETATQLVYLRKALPLAKLTVTPASGGRVTGLRRTAYGQVLAYETSGPHAPTIETEIILFDHEKKIEFINRLHKEPVRSKEGVYFAFPFAVAQPEFNYEIQNGWVDPAHNLLKGASLEWFTVQHWVRVADSEVAVGLVPVDAPLVNLGDINRGTWPEEFRPKSATVFSWVMNNYWHTNYRRVQTGDYTFRYILTSGSTLTPESLARLGRDAMTPLEAGALISNDKFDNPARPLTPAPTSFLEADAPNVALENWKTAEDGHGTILRLVEIAGQAATLHLQFPLFELKQAWLANAAEENQREIPVSAHSLEVPIQPHQVLTIRILALWPPQ